MVDVKKFGFAFKPLKVQEKNLSKFDFRKVDYNSEKLANYSVKLHKPTNDLFDLWSEKTNPEISESTTEPNLFKEESSNLKNYGSYHKDTDNGLSIEYPDMNYKKVQSDKDIETMKSQRLKESFDIFVIDTKEDVKPPVNNFCEAQVDEKFPIEDIGINYPKFENLEKIRIPQYKEQIKKSENYIQPQMNHYLNELFS